MNLNKQKGFTLIELMVTISLISIVSVILFSSYRGSGQKKSLEAAAQKVMSDLRELQSNAISNKEYGGAVYCGWGMEYIDSDTYTYYVGGTSGVQDCDDVAVDRDYQGAQDTLVETIDLVHNTQVEFASGFPDIFFESPYPNIYIGNDGSSGASTVITLQLISDPGEQKIITVTTSGEISIN